MTSHSPALPSRVDEAPPDHPKITAWEYVSYTMLCAVFRGLVAVVGVSGLHRLASAFGTLEWLINRKRRRRFHAALRQLGVAPASNGSKHPTAPKEARATPSETRRYFVQTRYDKILFLLLDTLPPDRARSLFRFDGKAAFDEALAQGRGLYLALSHHGPHHILAIFFSLCGYPTLAVRDRHESALRRFVRWRFDRCYPDRVRPRWFYSDAFPRELYRWLRKGHVVASTMDVARVHQANRKTEEVTIFGEARTFVSGPLRVAIRCGSPVVQGFVTPDRRYGYRFEIVERLFDPESGETEEEAVSRAMRLYAANVERYLRETPSLISRI